MITDTSSMVSLRRVEVEELPPPVPSGLQHLDELLARYKSSLFNVNEYVEFDGFDSLYVRVGKRFINDEYHLAIDIANVTAASPGNGAFKKLITHLKERWPQFVIHVECVMTQKFADGLLRMGFEETNQHMCFWSAR